MSMTKTQNTETAYRISIHAYLIEQGGKATCANPAQCRRPAHWELSESTFISAEAARQDLGPDGIDYDAPAVRIVKVTQVVTVETTEEEIDTVDLTLTW